MYTTGSTFEFETHSIFQPLIDAFISHYGYGNVDADKKLDKKFLKNIKKEMKTTKKAKLLESTFGKMFPRLAESIIKNFLTRDSSEQPSDYLLEELEDLEHRHKGHNH